MKLITSPTSVYGRKIRIMIREKQLDVEEDLINPWTDRQALVGLNPLSRVPVLVLDDDTCVYDSSVIAEYLDSCGPPRMIPANIEKRVRMLTACALCRQIVDSCGMLVVPKMQNFELAEKSRELHMGKIIAGLENLEERLIAKEFGKSRPWMLDLEAASLLYFLDFRLADTVAWRKKHKRLARWFTRFSKRESFIATAPPPPPS